MAPLVPLYAAGATLRARFQAQRKLSWPVVSIGNLSTGGSGKTPLAIYLAKQLAARGFHVDVLSRGYGRASSEPLKVDLEGSAKQYGDEPLLIAQASSVPVYVAARRYDAGVLAEKNYNQAQSGPQVHILDDGFQHRQLARDVDILLLNREDSNDSLLPAGNLREALHAATRANVIAIPEDDSTFEEALRTRGIRAPVWRIRRHMEVPELTGPAFAFCGIAKPEQFFVGLERAGVKLAETQTFRDHHSYSMIDLSDLARAAYAYGATALITTEKDRVRLGDLVASLPKELPLLTAKLSVTIEDEATAMNWLVGRLKART